MTETKERVLATQDNLNEYFKMNEGDRAIREILHLLEDNKDDVNTNGMFSATFLHHAILCASLLCLILFVMIIIIHSTRRRSTSSSSQDSSNRESHNRREDVSNNKVRDTVIVITDETNVDTKLSCDNNCSSSVSSV